MDVPTRSGDHRLNDGFVDPRPVLFLHIPKSAGTSFLLTLQNTFGDNRVYRIDEVSEQLQQTINDVMNAEISCLTGHLPIFHFLPYLDKFKPFTILRQPVERVLSLYQFLRDGVPAEHKRLGLSADFSLNEFINSRHPELYCQVNNGTTRMLCDAPGFYDPANRQFWNMGRDVVALEQAVANLKRIEFGLTEDMTQTLALARRCWSVPYELEEVHQNTSRNHPSVGIDDIRSIMSLNTLDLALYQQAQAIFRTRSDRLTLSAMDAVWNANSVFDPALGLEVGIGGVPGRQGFYEFEPDTQLAWLNPASSASIHFLSRHDQLYVNLYFYSVVPDYPVNDIVLRVNQQIVKHEVSSIHDGWFRVWADHLDVLIGINCIAVEAPLFIPVTELDPNAKDGRRLGIALAKVLIRSTHATS